MSGLIKCAECGRNVSSNVNQCPHCHGNPHTTKCAVCKNQMKNSEGDYFGSMPKHVGLSMAHKSCKESWQKSILSQTFSCSVCNCQFSYYDAEQNKIIDSGGDYTSSTSYYFKCPECGEKVEMLLCSNCGLLLHPSEKKLFTYSGHRGSLIFVHKSCLPMMKSRSKEKHFGIETRQKENSAKINRIIGVLLGAFIGFIIVSGITGLTVLGIILGCPIGLGIGFAIADEYF